MHWMHDVPDESPNRLTEMKYWDAAWQETGGVDPVDPSVDSPLNHVVRHLDRFFRAQLGDGAGKDLLEVGCAASQWLPYFATALGYRVYGLDYSQAGIEITRRTLLEAGVEPRLACADLFDPPAELLGAFDVVVSMGLVEHFTDTAEVLEALAAFLRDGGLLVTIVPNLFGVLGVLQRWLDVAVYRLHVPLRKRTLLSATDAAKLEPVAARYLVFLNFGVCNIGAAATGRQRRVRERVLYRAVWLNDLMWRLQRRLPFKLPGNVVTSPYLAVVARRAL